MTLKIAPHRPTPAQRGFTLVELMIAVVVVGVLLAIALPSFMDSVRKGRRAEAFAALAQVQAAQERERSRRSEYLKSVSAAPTADPPGLGLAQSTYKYYEIALVAPAEPQTWSSGYEVQAKAVAGSQLNDGACKVLAVRMEGGTITYGSGSAADSITWPDLGRCWAR